MRVCNDKWGLLKGDYKDGRRLVIFKGVNNIKAKEKALRNVVKEWLNLIEK